MASHFALTHPGAKDYGTGIALFRQEQGQQVDLPQKYYYKPEFKGSNFGVENCKYR